MKTVKQNELKVGSLYCDIPTLNSPHAVIMRYLGRVKGSHEFKYVSGNSSYMTNEDDIIRFTHQRTEPNWYHEVPKGKADIINQTKKEDS